MHHYSRNFSEPRYRGVLMAYSSTFVALGMLSIFILNTLMSWRIVALVYVIVPILSLIALCFVPETPMWLLSKNRPSDAEKSLRWLRGWVSKQAVAQELQTLKRYSERSKSCAICMKLNQKCSHPLPTMRDKFRELNRSHTLRPFFILMSLFFITSFSGIISMSPFIVQIFKAYDSPIEPDQTAALMSLANNVGNVVFLCLLRFTGKRRLYLMTLTGAFLSATVVCVYGFICLPSGYHSFDTEHYFALENKSLGYIPFVCIILWSFFTFCSIINLPWQMLSEVYPFK